MRYKLMVRMSNGWKTIRGFTSQEKAIRHMELLHDIAPRAELRVIDSESTIVSEGECCE